jgi:hypothetical protein
MVLHRPPCCCWRATHADLWDRKCRPATPSHTSTLWVHSEMWGHSPSLWKRQNSVGIKVTFCLLSYFEEIDLAYEITLLSVCVCACVSPLIVARQLLGKSHLIVARQRLGKNPQNFLCILWDHFAVIVSVSVCLRNRFVFCAVRVVSKESRRFPELLVFFAERINIRHAKTFSFCYNLI